MNRVNTLQGHIAAKAASGASATAPSSGVPSFTKDEIIAKRDEGQIWIVIKNNVYNVTDFLDEHPGGAELITDIPAGDFKAMTTEFNDADHSEDAMEQLQALFVGTLRQDDGKATHKPNNPNQSSGGAVAAIDGEQEEEEDEPLHLAGDIDPAKPFQGLTETRLTLLASEDLSHDVTLYRFALPRPTDEFSLMIGKHIVLSFEEKDGTHISRAYTPVSLHGDRGFVDFLIKRYPGGKMSEHLNGFRPGMDSIMMKGPKGKLGYLGNGQFVLRRKGHNETIQLDHVGMIAGGSGITPMFQIIQHVVRNPSDKLKITLIFANKTEQDIILKYPLDDYVRRRPGQIKIVYTLDQPPQQWKGEQGFVTEGMIKKYLPPPSKSSMVFLCGPPPMIKKACLPALKALQYPNEAILKF